MTTKKKSKKIGTTKSGNKKGGPVIEGSPITVGGGGGGVRPPKKVFCKLLNPADYPDRTGGSNRKKNFQSDALSMKKLIVWINRVKFDLTSLLPANGKCSILINAKGTDEDVEITGNKMGIKFHTGKYPPEAGANHESPDGANFIKKISVETPLGSFERKQLTAADEVEVFADVI